jgi:hypothetical protein
VLIKSGAQIRDAYQMGAAIFAETKIGSGWRASRRCGFPQPEVEFSGLLFAQAPMAEAITIPRPLSRINPALQGPGNVEPVSVPWRYPRA